MATTDEHSMTTSILCVYTIVIRFALVRVTSGHSFGFVSTMSIGFA